MNHILQHTPRSASGGVQALCKEIQNRHGNAAAAVLYYGSCFRRGDDSDGIVDLYVLVDSYRASCQRPIQGVLNRLLPPNVFYLQVPYEGRMVRAKYAVLSLADLERNTSMRCFHSYFWARFAQPTGLIYARNEQIAERVNRALAQAVMTFVVRVVPEVASPFTARDLWRTGLVLSYRAELRPERPDDVMSLFDDKIDYYEELTRAAMEAIPFNVEMFPGVDAVRYEVTFPGRVCRLNRLAWDLRSLQGKGLSFLRLFKGLFTFDGGLDYVQWKIARHSGVSVPMEPRMRRLPILGVCILFWRLYRRGGFR